MEANLVKLVSSLKHGQNPSVCHAHQTLRESQLDRQATFLAALPLSCSQR